MENIGDKILKTGWSRLVFDDGLAAVICLVSLLIWKGRVVYIHALMLVYRSARDLQVKYFFIPFKGKRGHNT